MALPRLNDAHGDVVAAFLGDNSAAVGRAIGGDVFVAGQALRQRCSVG